MYLKTGEKTVNSDAINLQLIELKDMIIQLNNTIAAQNALIQKYMDEIAKKEAIIADKEEIIKYLNHKIYGSSSEKGIVSDPGQISLFDLLGNSEQELPALILNPDPEELIHVKEHSKNRKPKPAVNERFANLPLRKVFVDTLSDEDKHCVQCGTEMAAIGTEVIRTEVQYTPAKLERVEYIATTYECPDCKETEEPYFIKDEECRPALLPPSFVSESLAASSFYKKFALSIPYYRQETDFKQSGVDIRRDTMANWAILCHQRYLSPMIEYFEREFKKRKFVMMDETPLQVLKEPGKTPQSKSYIRLARTGEDGLPPIILYHYSPTRSGDNAANILSGMNPGYYFMADGYNGYNKVKDGKRCVCFAHLRRYFLDAVPKGKESDFTLPAVQAVLYCNKLFEFERRYREKGYNYKKRYERRLKDEKPVLEAFLSWPDVQKPGNSSKWNTALTYARNRKEDLMTYLEDGRCSLSNNLSENSIRPITVGRKNWLFCDSQEGAYATVAMYTIFEMAKLYDLNQYEYMKFLLEQRPSKEMSDEELSKLAPWNEDVQNLCRIEK